MAKALFVLAYDLNAEDEELAVASERRVSKGLGTGCFVLLVLFVVIAVSMSVCVGVVAA